METKVLNLQALKNAVAGHAAAFRCVTEYQPAGGVGDKVFPPTYEGGKYAVEKRVIEGGEIVDCVLLDSVQSQANRMELALLEAWRTKDASGKRLIELPVVTVRFDAERLTKKFVVTSLDAPHRVADAILRDSLLDGVMSQEITHPVFGYAAQYRQIIEIQSRLLGRHLLGEIDEYPNFTTR